MRERERERERERVRERERERGRGREGEAKKNSLSLFFIIKHTQKIIYIAGLPLPLNLTMISRSALPRRPRRCPWRARALPPSTSPAPSCPMTTRAPRAPPPPRQPLVASPSRPVSSACRSGAQKVLPAPTWARSAPMPVSGNELENGRERERFAGRSRGVQNLPNLFPLLTKTSFF